MKTRDASVETHHRTVRWIINIIIIFILHLFIHWLRSPSQPNAAHNHHAFADSSINSHICEIHQLYRFLPVVVDVCVRKILYCSRERLSSSLLARVCDCECLCVGGSIISFVNANANQQRKCPCFWHTFEYSSSGRYTICPERTHEPSACGCFKKK